MKRQALMVLGLTAVIGVTIFWNQQGPAEPAALNLEKMVVSSKAPEIPTQAVLFAKKIDAEVVSRVDTAGTMAPPMTREEVVNAARRQAWKDSGWEKEMQERKRLVTARFEQMRTNHENTMGYNDRINKRFNINVKEKFNVDLDTSMAAIQAQRQRKDSAELEKRLAAWGVDAKQREEIAAMRKLVLDVGNNSN